MGHGKSPGKISMIIIVEINEVKRRRDFIIFLV